jgi:PAS domain S-box-containing protein
MKKQKITGSDSKPQTPLLKKGFSTDNPEINSIFVMMEKLLHWAAIIESSDDAIISKSADGFITSWNKGAQQLYGYTPEEIIGKPVSVLMPPEKKDDFPYIMKQLHEGKRVEHYETQRITKDGRILHVSITVSPIRDSSGNIIGASKIARDITERVENEKRRDEFVSTASHELKTPITSQKVFGELLEQVIDKEGYTKLKPYITKINQQTEKMTKLVEDLLELSRVQTARLKMENVDFLYDDLLHEVIENVQLTTKHTIILKGKTNKKVKGDRERVSQVLMNLLTNAIKYSPKSDKIIITTEVKDSEIVTGVQDFGIGVAKEYHHKIFERFFRVTDVDEKTYPGMGIGLFLSQEIVVRHGGTMWVESAKGKGATFYFTLPLSNGRKK